MRRWSHVFFAAVLLAMTPASGVTHAAAPRTQMTLTVEDYFSTQGQIAAFKSYFSQYEATHPGITIKHVYVPFGSLLSKVLQQAATHTLPDIVILNNLQVANIASAGLLAPISQYTKSWPQISGYYKSSLSTATYRGSLYGTPIGNNDLALFYNIQMFKAAGISNPPTTWAELRADAKKLTHGHTYGFVFSATSTDEAPWQWEPFLWSNGGSLHKVSAAPAVQSLSFLQSLVNDGSVSKSVVTFGQADELNQFTAGNAAMMENGPWNLSALNSTKGLQFGIAPLPRPRSSTPPTSPMGGEVWTIPHGTAQGQQAAWNLIQWMQDPQRLVAMDTLFGYLPAYGPATAIEVRKNPQLKVFAQILPTARFTAEDFGVKFPQVSQALIKAIQSALTGQQTPAQALQTAQSTIDSLQ